MSDEFKSDDLSVNLANVVPQEQQSQLQEPASQNQQQAAPEATQEQSTEPDWWYDEGMPGKGPRPDYLKEKYGYVQAKQAKAYEDAEKRLGGLKAAPDEYSFEEFQENIDRDNDTIKNFISFAKENKLQQDQFNKILKTFVDYDKSRQPKVDDEIAKLGQDGMQKVNTVTNWIKNNLTPQAQKALEKLPVRAEVVQMLDELRQLHTNTLSKVPHDTQKNESFAPITRDGIEDEMLANYKRYQTDRKYRDEISAKFAQVVGE